MRPRHTAPLDLLNALKQCAFGNRSSDAYDDRTIVPIISVVLSFFFDTFVYLFIVFNFTITEHSFNLQTLAI